MGVYFLTPFPMQDELVWAFLPEGLQEHFDIEKFEKNDQKVSIILIEKNVLPAEMPEEYRGKKVINTVLNDMVMEDFPIRGRKCEIVLRRRWWKFEGVDRMLMRSIDIFYQGMRYGKEFAFFLKELDRKLSSGDQSSGEK